MSSAAFFADDQHLLQTTRYPPVQGAKLLLQKSFPAFSFVPDTQNLLDCYLCYLLHSARTKQGTTQIGVCFAWQIAKEIMQQQFSRD